MRKSRAAPKRAGSGVRGAARRRGGVLGRLAQAALRGLALVLVAFVVLSATSVFLMRWVNPFGSAFMLGARWDAFKDDDEAYRTRQEWVSFDRISAHAAIAVIAAEDQRFPHHWGFDFKSIRQAVESNGRSRRVRGASTISQQTAKNLFLWSGRSYVRKGLEAWFTMLIEAMWSKHRILEVYLNVAEFGRGVYGVEAASRKYFRKPAAKLTASEAALLAAVLPSPRRMRADRPSRYVLSRREWILGQMRALGGRRYLDSLASGPGLQPVTTSVHRNT